MPRGILLAAGQSRRFGANKLLHPLADGTPIAVATARTLRGALPHSYAVVEDETSELARLLVDEGLHIVVNPHASEGMAGSIACGVNAADDADGWVIALADMPLLRTSSVAQVAAAIAFGARLAAPLYRGRRGHPVGFSREFGPSLRALQGEEGARQLVQQHRDALVELPLDDPGTVLDIDTPEDLPLPAGTGIP